MDQRPCRVHIPVGDQYRKRRNDENVEDGRADDCADTEAERPRERGEDDTRQFWKARPRGGDDATLNDRREVVVRRESGARVFEPPAPEPDSGGGDDNDDDRHGDVEHLSNPNPWSV